MSFNIFYFLIIAILVIVFLVSCKRNDCYKKILELAPTYIEIRTTYRILKPKAIELRNRGQIDDDTWKKLKKLDKKLTKLDANATRIYNKAINTSGELSEKDVELILGVTRDLINAVSLIVPKLII